ncbi:MAG TPA: G1 family glutamic endopeptidase [Pseudonocardiaceae bacterium]|nr:G1 family glutamic endopeptidase [Pseudonocardiaceae bacterium]
MGIRSLRFVAVAGVAAAVVLALAPAANAAAANGADHVVGHGSNVQQSSNWSGYAETAGGYTSATANWTVPSVSSSSSATYSSAWVGIDGDGNSNLIQTGTEADYYSGRAHYDAWWEILPAAETVITNITVHPGDSFTGTVSKVSGTTWKITLRDNTTGASFSSNKTYTGPGHSVEYIQEAPEVGGRIAKIAHFSTFSFSGLTVNGHSPGLVSADEIVLVQNGVTYSTPSAPNSAGNGFSVSYTG